VRNALKSGGPNFLEPLGPVQACNGIALPLTLLHLYQLDTFYVVNDYNLLIICNNHIHMYLNFVEFIYSVTLGI
jgi:hypothetical protein